jgi:short-subunit dehydrogenase
MIRGNYYWLIGASEGIGEALALSLARDGVNLILSARNADKLQQVLAALTLGDHHVVPVDVADAVSLARAWERITALPAPLDGLIYNAGTYAQMSALSINVASAEQMMNTNFTGALRAVALVLPGFIARNAGHIALVASVAGFRGLPDAIGYGASKAALIHFAENLKADLTYTALKIQVINPGFVATRLTANNTFNMPFIISPEKAAAAIHRGLVSNRFEIYFPKRFTLILKFFTLLPHRVYFRLLRLLKME